MNRRNLILTGAAAAVAGGSLRQANAKYSFKEGLLHDFRFDALHKWVNNIGDSQVDGSPTNVCNETGNVYRILSNFQLCRPGDELVAEKLMATRLQYQIRLFAMEKEPKHEDGSIGNEKGFIVYWRERLETEIRDHNHIIGYCDDGPDIDPIFKERCVMDRNWRAVSAYCRLDIKWT